MPITMWNLPSALCTTLSTSPSLSPRSLWRSIVIRRETATAFPLALGAATAFPVWLSMGADSRLTHSGLALSLDRGRGRLGGSLRPSSSTCSVVEGFEGAGAEASELTCEEVGGEWTCD